MLKNTTGITPNEPVLAFTGWMLISEYIKQRVPLAASLAIFAVGVYIVYQFHGRIPALAWTKTKKLDHNEP